MVTQVKARRSEEWRQARRPETGSSPARAVRRAGTLLRLELDAWSALLALLLRHGRSSRAEDFSYASALRLPMAVLLGLTLVDVPVLSFLAGLLLPWAWARVAVLAVGLWAVWVVASLWAGLVTRPHSIRGGELHLRAGLLGGLTVPLADIEAVGASTRHWSALLGPLIREGVGAFPAGGSTNLMLRLRRPALLWRALRSETAVHEIHLHADEPARLLRALSEAKRRGPS